MLIERWSNKRSSEDVMKIIPPLRNSESNKRSSEDVMKIIPPLRNSESNKRSSEDHDDQIWD